MEENKNTILKQLMADIASITSKLNPAELLKVSGYVEGMLAQRDIASSGAQAQQKQI